MSPFADSLVVILAVSAVVLLVAVLLVLIGIAGRLTRIQGLLTQQAAEPSPLPEKSPSKHAGGAFERFLEERPECRNLPKGEQFAAYRAWRKAQGMNWESR